MAITGNLKHTWSTSIKNDSGAAVVADPPVIVPFDDESNGSVKIPTGETAEVDVIVDVSTIQSAFITSDKDVTVKTNAVDAAGGQTIEILAGKSANWNVFMSTANPFTPDITKMFIHNASGAVATVRWGFGVNIVA